LIGVLTVGLKPDGNEESKRVEIMINNMTNDPPRIDKLLGGPNLRVLSSSAPGSGGAGLALRRILPSGA
jgi:hypothetical protein